MKKVIILLVIITCNNVYSQPTRKEFDVINGSSIRFNNFTSSKKGINLFINRQFPYDFEYTGAIVDTENLYFPLKKSESKDSIFEQIHIKTKYGDFYTCNLFKFKRSGMDNSFQNLHFIYNNEIMTIKVKKNLAGVKLIFKEFIFKEGVFEVDFKKIAKEKLFKNKKMPKFLGGQKIRFCTFPFEDKKK